MDVMTSDMPAKSTARKAAAVEKPRPNYKYLREKDREMVRGMFHFYETPGGMLEFSFKKWPQDPVERFSLHDNEIYTIPLGVAKWLVESGWYPAYKHVKDEKSGTVQKVTQKIQRYSFESLEFMDIDDLGPAKSIITVENVG